MRVCGSDEISEGQVLAIECNDTKLMLVREADRVYASERTCTHAEADLSTGFFAPGAGSNNTPGVRCPLHLSVFDMETGVPLNPPAEKKLCTYPAKMDGNSIYVEM